MDQTKAWWESKAVWANVVVILVGAAQATGLIDATTGSQLTADLPGILVGLATSVAGIAGIYGRVVATRQIRT